MAMWLCGKMDIRCARIGQRVEEWMAVKLNRKDAWTVNHIKSVDINSIDMD